MADTTALTNIPIAMPEPGQRVMFVVSPGHAYVLGFEPSSALFEKQGDNLHIDFDNGGALSLHRFFSSLHDGGFHLVLPDGASVDARDLAEALLMPIEEIAPRAALAISVPTDPDMAHGEALVLEDLLDLSGTARTCESLSPGDLSPDASPFFTFVADAARLCPAPVPSPLVDVFTRADAGCGSDEDFLAAYLHIVSL